MNIIIPIGGKGERFIASGYKEHKPLINILGKQMIYYVLDNLRLNKEDNIFIIYYNIEDKIFKNVILEKYPNINFIRIYHQTKGAAETIYEGLKEIINITQNNKTMLLDCDTFYTTDVISMYKNINENAVFYTVNTEDIPIYSYINFDDNNVINKIAEKNKISNFANSGIYCFNDINVLFNYSKFIVENNIVTNNECYTSCIIEEMIKESHIFKGIELNNNSVFSLGTPKQVNQYINETNLFLFDLDGTLIVSENIYYDVWCEILREYGIQLSLDVFQNKISGNSDEIVIKFLLPQLKDSVNKISQKKDLLFIKQLHKITLIDGVEQMLKTIKTHGHKIALVTNCNRVVSESIIEHFNLNMYFEFIIIGNECNHPKPYPDPYIVAINKFNGTSKNTIIFEDSKSGLLSANGVNPKCIVGIETFYSKNELLENFANITMKDYNNFDINQLINYNNNYENNLENMIMKSINIKLDKIKIHNNKLKGGFISDVINIELYTEDNIINCIAKMENCNDNCLSEMSNKLDLYSREYYFYKYISHITPIKTPKCYGLIYDETKNKNIGILLENINDNNHKLNLNLNSEDICVSFKVIESLALMHSKFWNKNTSEFFNLKKNNDKLFNPFWGDFISSKWTEFKTKWCYILTYTQLEIGEYIVKNFSRIQQNLSDTNLTLCHGDVKSANIFYKILDNKNYEPIFIDWQYITNGKGVQDLVFLMIESFDLDKMKIYKNLFKEYYYVKLLENGVSYSKNDYYNDFETASYYFPFFVSIWFGTIPEDNLIDKNFPYEFIKKTFNFYII